MKSLEDLRADAWDIYRSGLEAVKPSAFMKNAVRFSDPILSVQGTDFNLDAYERIYLIGSGKAAAAMAAVMEQMLERRISGGIIVTKDRHAVRLQRCPCIEAGHPVPDYRSARATEEIIQLLKSAGERDLILYVLSGGTSSLLASAPDGLSFDDIARTYAVLARCGASIREVNIIRKKISGLFGGRFSALAYPATVVTLALSDVPGDDMESIGSGPTVPDTATTEDVRRILDHDALYSKIPAGVCDYLTKPAPDRLPAETFRRTHNFILANIHTALTGCASKARDLGYEIMRYPDLITGDAAGSAGKFIRQAQDVVQARAGSRLYCFLAGGETTVKVTGTGIGGRNQEFALAALQTWNSPLPYVLLAAGTDGTDGPTEQAGAWADPSILQKAVDLKLNPDYFLQTHDAYRFFKRAGGHVFTGPTGTNVMDIIILIIQK